MVFSSLPSRFIYIIILLKYVCMSQLANCRSQFLPDRLGRCLKLSVSTGGPYFHEFVSQFGLAIFYTRKTPKNYAENWASRKCLLNEPATDPSKMGGNAGHGRSIASDQLEHQQRLRS